jgi:8-oxo-dGTP diphosphatase
MQTVTAAILGRDGKILIARRPASSKLANKWEFPGGKVEDGETPEACLARELKEELDIEVGVGPFLGESIYHYEYGSIKLLAYETHWIAGEMVLRDHDEIRWVSFDELDCFEFAPADLPFVNRLKDGAINIS